MCAASYMTVRMDMSACLNFFKPLGHSEHGPKRETYEESAYIKILEKYHTNILTANLKALGQQQQKQSHPQRAGNKK